MFDFGSLLKAAAGVNLKGVWGVLDHISFQGFNPIILQIYVKYTKQEKCDIKFMTLIFKQIKMKAHPPLSPQRSKIHIG